MSTSNDTVDEARHQTSTENRNALGMLRRMAITVTRRPFWQAVGVLLLDGVTREAPNAEVFSGIGFYSRPAPGVRAEAIIGHVGGPENPVILATRDEDTRRRVAQLDQDETAIYNTLATVVVKKTGTVEIRLAAGVAQKTLLGETYRAAEDAMLTAVSSAIALISNIPGLTAPQLALVTAATAAITAFKAAAATYLTSVAKVQ